MRQIMKNNNINKLIITLKEIDDIVNDIFDTFD